MPKRFNYDRFTGVDPKQSAQCAMAVLTALQKYPPEVQAAGLSVAFAHLIDRFGLHAGNALQVANNLLVRERHTTPELRAVEMYVEKEL